MMSGFKKAKVYVTGVVPQIGIELLEKGGCQVEQWKSDKLVPLDVLLESVRGVDALFCKLTEKIDSKVLDAAGPQLKVIGTMSVGYEHLDIPEIKKRNIIVGYTPEVLTDATAELTVALLLATSRRLTEAVHEVKCGGWGSWQPLWMCGKGLKDSTVGIVGAGRIGQGVLDRLKPFKVKQFLYCDRNRKQHVDEKGGVHVDLDTLLAESDFVVVCCASTPETAGLFNTITFKKMKSDAILINTSRGNVVVMDDLADALKAGTIGAAGLDVTVPEPLPTNSPLLNLKNCVVLPHIGSAVLETRAEMAALTARNILAGLKGEPLPSELAV